MSELMLLTDGSVNTQSHIGYEAYLTILACQKGLSDLKTTIIIQIKMNLSR